MKQSRPLPFILKTLAIAIGVALLCVAATVHMDQKWVDLLDRAGIFLGLILAALAAGGGLLALAQKARLTAFLQRLGRRRHYANVRAVTEGLHSEFRAVVLPVSNRQVPEWVLTHLRPRVAALLYTRETEATALELMRAFEGAVEFVVSAADVERGLGFRLGDPNQPEESRTLVKFFLGKIQERGIEPRQIVVDTTGGKVPMSLGAFQAAEEAGAASMYVVGKQLLGERPGFIVDPEDIAAGEVIVMSRPG